MAIATPSFLASLKSRMVLPFSCWLTQDVLAKRLLASGVYYIQLYNVVWHILRTLVEHSHWRTNLNVCF